MHYHYSLVLFALSCGIVAGQRLTKSSEPSHAHSLSWLAEEKPVQSSSDSSKHDSIQNQAGLQAALGRNEIVADINLPRLHGNELAAIYRTCTGRRAIISAAAAAAEFSLVFEASLQHPVPKAEVAKLLRKSANIEGFAFTPDDMDPNLDFLIPAKRTQMVCESVPFYSESTPLPDGDEVISYVVALKYLKPELAVAMFTKAAGEIGSYSSIFPVSNASAIIITDNTLVIRKLIERKSEIDKPQG